MKRKTILETIVMLYVILFLYTAISKLQDYSVFKEQIAESPLLAAIAKPVAFGLPIIEFLTVLMLIIPRWRLKGLYASLSLMLLFTAYVIGIMLFDEKLPCSCGGILQQLSWSQHLLFNSIFILLVLWAIILLKREKNGSENMLLPDNFITTQKHIG